MSYTPTTWQTGDTITAEKLNNMESGIAAANEGEILHIPVRMSDAGYYYIATGESQEIYEAIPNHNRFAFDLYIDRTSGWEMIASFPAEYISLPSSAFFSNNEYALFSEIGRTAGSAVLPDSSTQSLTLLSAYYTQGNWYLNASDPFKLATNYPFIVELVPTAQDFSGTMNRTPQEITEAYNAGRSIVFKILASPTLAYYVQATLSSIAASDEAAQFAGYGIITERFVVFETDVSMQTYSTAIYQLTPAT
jgi:hypothetical protein